MNIDELIYKNYWRFAKTYANTHPHEYIIKNKCSSEEDFNIICEYINKNGHYEYFFNKRGTYCSIGDFTYWVMGDVINRRLNKMYSVNERGQIIKNDDWKEYIDNGRILHSKKCI